MHACAPRRQCLANKERVMTLKWTWTFGLGLAVLTAAGLGAQSTVKAQGGVADVTVGKPMGHARMAAVAIAVPPPPPSAMTP